MGWLRRGAIPAFLFTCATALGAVPAQAESHAKSIFNHLNHCASAHAIDDCRQYVTSSSTALFDRFNGYGLANCLPEDVRFLSEISSGPYTIIRARMAITGKTRFLRLLFSEEKGQWKLDIPASLQHAMGDRWQHNLALTEALYVALRQQMGGKLDCKSARAMIQ